MIPLFIFYILMTSITRKQDGYSDFIVGARKGFQTVLHIAPTLVGLMVAVGIMRASGLLDWIAQILSVIGTPLHIPSELIPLILVRMFSSSAATGIVLDLYKNYGTDSSLGMASSIIMGCSETIFYTISIYYMSVKVTKSRYTLVGAMLATITGIIASLLIVGFQ